MKHNLKKSFPQKSEQEILQLEKQFIKYFSDLLVEDLKMFTISEKEARKRIIIHNTDVMDQYFKEGKSVLIYGSHYGNWEWASFANLCFKHPMNTVYKPLSNPYFEEWLNQIREQFGTKMVPMKTVNRKLIEFKNSPQAMIFVSDQTPLAGETRYFLNFLNQETAVFQGLEKIARKTNYPVFCCHFKVIKRGYYEAKMVLMTDNPKEMPENQLTHQYYSMLESHIQQDPAYWLWSHKRWKFSKKDVHRFNS